MLTQHGWKAANDNEKTFDAAADSYLRMGGSQRYVAPVVEYFSGRLVATIVSTEVRQTGIEVFPICKAATINRQVLTPARAILNHAHEFGWCSAIRVRSFKIEKPVKLPAVNGEWMSKFISQANADGLYHLSAVVFFMQDCAARVSEACNVLGEHVDIKNKTIRLAKTKTEERDGLSHVRVRLPHRPPADEGRRAGFPLLIEVVCERSHCRGLPTGANRLPAVAHNRQTHIRNASDQAWRPDQGRDGRRPLENAGRVSRLCRHRQCRSDRCGKDQFASIFEPLIDSAQNENIIGTTEVFMSDIDRPALQRAPELIAHRCHCGAYAGFGFSAPSRRHQMEWWCWVRVSEKSGQDFRKSPDTVFSNSRTVIPLNPGQFPAAV
ncbi:hypothetical protein [Rhizobium sp. BK376]|uniref:hypothetical protein n=1 Tax=Rhizobium sp. BK376 TaxID=2512149 RepID=UPI0010520C45|nr:hypothetical protein [Rhizobium sp. BK376]TCR69273.1 hypothetical protein EV561_1411 [Rhizobium sp. BK376]